ncbi:MAG: ATP synthase F1 subunit epsilon [Acidobacteria bacterium]|nr:ATP synthase F1 subunit epsilon [Acidobacteriota bacterium]
MIHLEVVTPERKVFEADVDSVEVPGFDGELGILPGHTELVSKLKPAGLLTYHIGDEKGEMVISDGFVEVSPKRVTVLADRANRPEDLDLTSALAKKAEAEKLYQKAMSDSELDIKEVMAGLDRANLEAQLAENNK